MSDSAGMKSKLLSLMSCTPRRQQANNVTGNRQLAGDVEISDTASNIMLPIRTFNNLMAMAERWDAGMKSKFTIFIHAHYVNCKLTTSQETDSRPKMWTCPTPPV